jgi:hypothetical protein
MNYYLVGSSRGQMKIQQMAFVLMAIFVFFVLVGVLYVSFKSASLEGSAEDLREEAASELVKKLASSPEFSWTEDCANCLDFDKAFVLKDRESYEGFWNLDYLMIEVIGGTGEECNPSTYPECGKISIIEKENYGTPKQAFVAVCWYENTNGGYNRCGLGRIHVSGEDIE